MRSEELKSPELRGADGRRGRGVAAASALDDAAVTNGIPTLAAGHRNVVRRHVGVGAAGRPRGDVSTVSQAQVAPHAAYGGIVPEVASRIHAEAIDSVCAEALAQAGVEIDEIGAVAVTVGPGLPGSLLVGLEFARGLAFGLRAFRWFR